MKEGKRISSRSKIAVSKVSKIEVEQLRRLQGGEGCNPNDNRPLVAGGTGGASGTIGSLP